jgi:hypothetical protein
MLLIDFTFVGIDGIRTHDLQHPMIAVLVNLLINILLLYSA